MASGNPLRKIIDWFNASDVVDSGPGDGEPTAPPAPAPDPPQKRQRGPLTLRTTTEGGLEIRHPRSLDERLVVGEDLKCRRLVTLDLTGLPEGEARYFLEFIYGVVFALDATAEKVTDNIYLLAPPGVSVHNNTVPADAAVAAAGRSRGRDVQEESFWPVN